MMTQIFDPPLKEPTDNIFIQLFRYGFVGGTAFIIDYATLWTFTEYLGLHYQAGACAGFLAGLTVNYLSGRVAEFVMFAVIGIIGLLLNALIMWTATDICGIYYMLSKLISTAIVFVWNFLGRRFLMSKISILSPCKNPSRQLGPRQ